MKHSVIENVAGRGYHGIVSAKLLKNEIDMIILTFWVIIHPIMPGLEKIKILVM